MEMGSCIPSAELDRAADFHRLSHRLITVVSLSRLEYALPAQVYRASKLQRTFSGSRILARVALYLDVRCALCAIRVRYWLGIGTAPQPKSTRDDHRAYLYLSAGSRFMGSGLAYLEMDL